MNSEQIRLLEQIDESMLQNELFGLLLTQPPPEVKFLNHYKEVPVSAAARILHTSDNVLFCRTNKAQERIIEFSKSTIIKTPQLKHDVYAAASYNPDTREVALSDFCYAEVLSGLRSSIRVRMHVPLAVSIVAGTQKLNGRMLDLSLDGCAVEIMDRALMGDFTFFRINFEMRLKTRPETIKASAMVKLIKIVPHDKLFRCVFSFEHDKSSEGQIGRLIALRQAEIIRELWDN